MLNQEIANILRELHSNSGHPRLEIEGAGEPSIESQYLTWIKHRKEGEGNDAVYVINDWYEDTSYVTEYKTECLQLPKSGIVELVQSALQAGNKEATLKIAGRHIRHYERWDDYSDSHDGSPEETHNVSIDLSLKLTEEKPILSVKYQ